MVNYFISQNKSKFFENSFLLGDFYLSYSDNTDLLISRSVASDTKICILGYCIDARGEIDKDLIPEHLCLILDSFNNSWPKFIKETARLAGDFVIAVYCSDYFRIINDATGRVGIYYSTHEKACSSSDALLAKHIDADLNPIALKIREGATGDGQPLPNDITDYKDIYISLPNFYFDINTSTSTRFFPSEKYVDSDQYLSVNECLERSHELITNIVKAYSSDCKLICPVTAGWDSRVNYSFLKKDTDIETFTFYLPEFTDSTPDIYVPKLFLKTKTHKTIRRIDASESTYEQLKKNVTPYPGNGAVSYAYTFLEQYDNKVFIGGDIISHIGSSAIGLDLPECFATKMFFKCKLHNFSIESEKELDKYIQSINTNISNISLFDLFSWENRLGRWAHEKNKIMSSMGAMSLNIYNCREVLELWLKIPRKERNKSNIQGYYLSKNAPDLLSLPFNPKERFGWMKKSSLIFLIASYSKHYLNLVKRKIKKRT